MHTPTAAKVMRAPAALACTGGVAVLTYPRWRPWCLTWGATQEEAGMTLPGDEQLEDPDVVTTRAIGINVAPSSVWPWIVQMGPGRAGAYTYDWIENLAGLDMHSSDEILTQYQHLEVGDSWQLGSKGPVLRAVVLDPASSLVLRSDDGNWVWAFALVPDGSGTRLVSRNRIRQARCIERDAGLQPLRDGARQPRDGAQDAVGHQGAGRRRRDEARARSGRPDEPPPGAIIILRVD